MALLTLLLITFLALGQAVAVLIIPSSTWVGLAFFLVIPVFYAVQNWYVDGGQSPRDQLPPSHAS
jgi:hypothetical protein